ncbi:NADH dehydrogenase [ubiquinone] 1 alpha subcomplex subunit 8-B isoform A, partial [Glycine soja]
NYHNVPECLVLPTIYFHLTPEHYPNCPILSSFVPATTNHCNSRFELQMASAVDASGNPIPTSAVLMASSKHIGIRCHSENLEFLKCKKKDQNPENCLDKGRDVTRCVLGLLKDLHQKCTKEMDDYVGCMYYHTNEFDLCRKEQQAFEKKCSLE